MALGLTQPLTEMSTRNISWGIKGPVPRVDNLSTSMCRLFGNLGASNTWTPQGLSRHVMRLLYLYMFINGCLYIIYSFSLTTVPCIFCYFV